MAGHRKWSGPACTYCGRKVQHRDPSTCWSRMWARMTGRIPAEDRARIEAEGRRYMQMLAAGGAVEVGR